MQHSEHYHYVIKVSPKGVMAMVFKIICFLILTTLFIYFYPKQKQVYEYHSNSFSFPPEMIDSNGAMK